MNNGEMDKKTHVLSNKVLSVCFEEIKENPIIVSTALILALAKTHHLFLKDKIELETHAEAIKDLFINIVKTIKFHDALTGIPEIDSKFINDWILTKNEEKEKDE